MTAVEQLVESQSICVDVEFFCILPRVELRWHVVSATDLGHHDVALVQLGNSHVSYFCSVVHANKNIVRTYVSVNKILDKES